MAWSNRRGALAACAAGRRRAALTPAEPSPRLRDHPPRTDGATGPWPSRAAVGRALFLRAGDEEGDVVVVIRAA